MPESSGDWSPYPIEPDPVLVRYPMTQEIWNKVVVEPTKARRFVDEERDAYFIVEYPTQADFDMELARFEGLIEHEVLP